jgi:hypothetical protein
LNKTFQAPGEVSFQAISPALSFLQFSLQLCDPHFVNFFIIDKMDKPRSEGVLVEVSIGHVPSAGKVSAK